MPQNQWISVSVPVFSKTSHVLFLEKPHFQFFKILEMPHVTWAMFPYFRIKWENEAFQGFRTYKKGHFRGKIT